MPVTAALQVRSQRTLDRILDAAESILQEKSFEALTLSEVVKQAGSSTGSFYARFSEKETLRACLIDRYHDDLVAVSSRLLPLGEWPEEKLAVRAELFIKEAIKTCRRRRGLMRMRYQFHLSSTDAVSPDGDKKMQLFYEALSVFFAPCMGEVSHPAPDRAFEFALQLVDSLIVSTMLFERRTTAETGSEHDEYLAGEIRRAFLAYLGAAH